MNITQKIISFQKGYWTLDNTIQDIRLYCLNWLAINWGWSKEESSDFFTYIQPQVIRALYTYSFNGKSFLRYLRRLTHFQIRTYSNTKRTLELKQESIAKALQRDYQLVHDGRRQQIEVHDKLWPESREPGGYSEQVQTDFLYCSEGPSYTTVEQKQGSDIDMTQAQKIMRDLEPTHKRLVLRALQKAEELNDNAIKQLSQYTGMPAFYLLTFRQQAFDKIESKMQQRNTIRIRRIRKFMRMCFDNEEPENQEMLKAYLSKTLKNIQRMNVSPSHTELSEITGLAKGTIGSSLYYQDKIQSRIRSNIHGKIPDETDEL